MLIILAYDSCRLFKTLFRPHYNDTTQIKLAWQILLWNRPVCLSSMIISLILSIKRGIYFVFGGFFSLLFL